MPFQRFKERHEGMGPFEAAYEGTFPGGFFGIRGRAEQRDLTNELIAKIESDDELEGLRAAAETGRAPMTREQHEFFRGALTAAADNVRSVNSRLSTFADSQEVLRNRTVSPDDADHLNLFDMQAAQISELMRSIDPDVRARGESQFGELLDAQRSYLRDNEVTRAELKAADDAGRNERRKEFQGMLNPIFNVMRQDRANYAALAEQLEDGAPDENASPALVTQLLQYTGASVRASDDGNWTLNLGPIGLGDNAVPTMTYSQIRRQLEQSHQGRDQFLSGEVANIAGLAGKQGFGINGESVDDLVFPLAGQVYQEREAAQEPKTPLTSSPEESRETGRAVGGAARNFFEGAWTAVGSMLGADERFVDQSGNEFLRKDYGGGRYGWEAVEPDPEAPPRPIPRARDNLPGRSRGVWIPPFMRPHMQPRRPVND